MSNHTGDPREASSGGSTVHVRRIELQPASSIHSARVRWLWPDRIPLRGLVVIAGEKGLGKSILTNAWIAAQLTRGHLDGELKDRPVDVLIATAEDDWESVIKPRLMVHGADLDRVHRVRVQDKGGESLLTLPDDIRLMQTEVDRLHAEGRTIGLLVVDPIGAFLSGETDTHKDSDVRRALAPLAAMAERSDLAVIVVAHLTKDESRRVINRVSGAGAFVNAARSVLAFARDPSDPAGEQGCERVLVQVASNWGRYAASISVRIESRLVKVDDGSEADVGFLTVLGESSVSVDDLQRGRPDEDATDCEESIAVALSNGRRPSREVKAEVAAELGCHRKTVERAGVRMEKRGELKVESGGFPRTTTWELLQTPTGDAAGGDSGSEPVGTSSEAKDVPTGRRDAPTGYPASSGDNGVARGDGVPAGGDVLQVAHHPGCDRGARYSGNIGGGR